MQYLLLASIGIIIGMAGMAGCDKYFQKKGYEKSPVNENQTDKTIKTAIVAGVIATSVIGAVLITKSISKKL
jgi:hypothetical protein